MFRVSLSHAKNPDIPGGYWVAAPRDRASTRQVDSIAEASRVVRDYIERNQLGGGNWTGGEVVDTSGATPARYASAMRAARITLTLRSARWASSRSALK